VHTHTRRHTTCTHMRTQTHTHTYTHTHTHMHRRTQLHRRTHAQTHTHTHEHTTSLSSTLAHTHAHIHTHTCTHSSYSSQAARRITSTANCRYNVDSLTFINVRSVFTASAVFFFVLSHFYDRGVVPHHRTRTCLLRGSHQLCRARYIGMENTQSTKGLRYWPLSAH